MCLTSHYVEIVQWSMFPVSVPSPCRFSWPNGKVDGHHYLWLFQVPNGSLALTLTHDPQFSGTISLMPCEFGPILFWHTTLLELIDLTSPTHALSMWRTQGFPNVSIESRYPAAALPQLCFSRIKTHKSPDLTKVFWLPRWIVDEHFKYLNFN